MIKKIKLKIKLLSLISFVGVFTTTLFITSNSCSSDQRIKYDGTKESLEQIAKNINWESFDVDTKLKLSDVKSSDIRWKDASYYNNIEMKVTIIEKLKEFEGFPNVVKFEIDLIDKNNNSISFKPNKFYFIGYFV